MKWLQLLVCCAVLSGGAAARPKNPAGPVVSIRIVNYEVVPVATLARSEAAASRILADAGVNVAWIHCAPPEGPNPCGKPIPSKDVSLQVLRRSPTNLHGDTAGFAVLYPGEFSVEGYAAVSYPDVQRVARALEREEWEVLTIVLAHELGHLLLGSGRHSREGVMSPRIGHEQLALAGWGELHFSSQEAAKMQMEALRRARQ